MISRIDHSSSSTPTTVTHTRLVYESDTNNCVSEPDKLGWEDGNAEKHAPFIKKLGYMTDDGNGGGNQLFGLTEGNNGNGDFKHRSKTLYAFRVTLDANGDPSTDASHTHIKFIDRAAAQAVTLGMRGSLEYDTSDSFYYLHFIWL